MSRAPRAGATKSRLARAVGTEAAALLARAFLLDASDAVRGGRAGSSWHAALFVEPAGAVAELGALTGIEDARPQAGGDLGQRMLAAIEELAGDGYAPLVIVGSDIPAMRARHIEDALTALDGLDGSDIVFGPAEDGGYYLVGMSGPHPELFGPGIEWGGGEVLAASERLAREVGLTAARIAVERDIDTVEDLDWLRGQRGLPRWTAEALAESEQARTELARPARASI
jgi:rSAM/selenodomain-associated transferase 1